MIWRSWLAACALMLCTANAHAQDVLSKKAAAEALFDQGLSLMRESRYSEACLRLEQSQALERGIGTMMYLGDCYEQLGRSASAWALFRQAGSEARAAGQLDRATQANERAAAVEPHVAKLVVETAPGAVVPGLTLSIDDVTQPDGMWGVALPVDPGEHDVKVSAPGHSTWSTQVTVPASAVRTVTTPKLAAAKPSAAPAIVATPAVVAVPAAAPRSDRPARSKFTRRLAIGLASAGVATALVGVGFGVRATHKNDDAGAYCEGSGCTDPRGISLTDDALSSARAANGLIIGGSVLAVAGLVVAFYHPWDRAQLALRVDGQHAALAFGGSF